MYRQKSEVLGADLKTTNLYKEIEYCLRTSAQFSIPSWREAWQPLARMWEKICVPPIVIEADAVVQKGHYSLYNSIGYMSIYAHLLLMYALYL